MKLNQDVSSSRRKARKAHFQAPSHLRRKIMSSALSADLKKKHNVVSIPVRKNDEVKIVRGTYKGREGRVTAVYRKKWTIQVDRITKDKVDGQQVPVGLNPSNVVITKLHLDKDRNSLLLRKAEGRVLRVKPVATMDTEA